MELNTAFYSALQEDVPDVYGVRRFTKTYKSLLNDGDLPFNEKWDETLSPWAIGKTGGNYDNDLIKKCWTFPDIDRIRFNPSAPDSNLIKRAPLYADSEYYPFWLQFQDGGQGSGYGYANWNERNAYDVTELPDTSSVKTNNYIATAFNYKRFVFLIEVYIYEYGEDNSDLTTQNYASGIWRNMSEISDSMYSEILNRQKAIGAIRFIPYYATAENNENSRVRINSTQFKPLCDFQPLDFFFGDEPYTTDYIDYTINSYAGIGSYTGNYGVTTTSLGMQQNSGFSYLCKYRWDWNWFFYDTLTSWGADWFQKSQTFQNFGTDSDYWYNNVFNGNDWQYVYFRQILSVDLLNSKDKIIDYIYTQAAYLGTFFTPNYTTAISGKTDGTDENMYIGVIGDNGITTGIYKHGSELPDVPQSEWVNPWDFSPFVPTPTDPNTYDDDNETIFNDVIIRPEFCTRYALTRIQLIHANSFLCSQISANVDSDFWSAQKLYVNNPIDVVQSVMLFPFDISRYQTDEAAYKDLTFGQLVDSGYSVQLNREQYCVINMGECTYYPTFGNSVDDFRNYPPYSTATLYIPYCGSVEIDPNLYMGHAIGVKIIVDMGTGSCLALILRDKLVVDSISGTMGITVPITGIQTQTLAAAERQAETQLKMARINGAFSVAKSVTGVSGGATTGALGGFMTGGLAGAIVGGVMGGVSQAVNGAQNIINSVEDVRNAQYNLEHVHVPYKTIGTATSTTSFANERKCRLIIRRPVMMNFDSVRYAHNTGYACLKTGVVSDFTGYTEFQTVDMSGVNATSTEKEMLFKLMQGGVFN